MPSSLLLSLGLATRRFFVTVGLLTAVTVGLGASATAATASKVHLNLYQAFPNDPPYDSRGGPESDLQGMAAEFDPVTGYLLAQFGARDVTSEVLFGYLAPDGSCSPAGGVTIDIPASGTPATWHMPDGSTVVVDVSDTVIGTGQPGLRGSSLEERPELMTATPWNCVQASTRTDTGETLDTIGPAGFAYLPYDDGNSQPAPAPVPVAAAPEPKHVADVLSVGTRLRHDRAGDYVSLRARKAFGGQLLELRATAAGRHTVTLSAARLARGYRLRVGARRPVRVRLVVALVSGTGLVERSLHVRARE